MPGNAHTLRLQGYCDGQARRLEQQRRDRALSPTAPKTRQAAGRMEGWPLASSSREPSGGPMKPWRMAGRHLDVEPARSAFVTRTRSSVRTTTIGRLDVRMTHQLLHGPDIHSTLEHVRGQPSPELVGVGSNASPSL